MKKRGMKSKDIGEKKLSDLTLNDISGIIFLIVIVYIFLTIIIIFADLIGWGNAFWILVLILIVYSLIDPFKFYG